MAVEFVNALNAAAAAESECAKLRRLLEEERKLMHRLKQEKEDEAEMAKRKIERMSQRLAGAQKDVEYATARADVAENEWVKLRRELRESQELVQVLKPESEETRQIVLRQGDDKELELANALNVASVAERECDKLRTLLEEERKLVQRLIVEKEDEAQLAKGQIEEIGQELADARRDANYATARADVAETELIRAKKELEEEKELSQLLKPECDEFRQSAMRQVKEKEQELVNVLHASEIAEHERAKLKRMLEEEKKVVGRLILEKDDEVQLAKRKIKEIGQELAHARELARKDADAAEHERAKLKRMLEEEKKVVGRLILEKDDEVQLAKRKIKEIGQELAHARELARKDADAAEHERAKLKRMLEEEKKVVGRLILEKDDEVRLAKRKIKEIGQELAHGRELARKDADAAEHERAKLKRMLEEEKKVVGRLILEKDDEVRLAKRKIKEIGQELAHGRELARKDADAAERECAKLKRMLEEEKKVVGRLMLEKDDEVQLAKRKIDEIDQGLAHAREDAELARKDADAAERECAKLKRMLEEEKKVVGRLILEKDDEVQLAKRKIEEIDQGLAHAREDAKLARKDADVAERECAKLRRMLEEEKKVVGRLILEKDDEVQLAKRKIEEIGQELAHARELARKDADAAEIRESASRQDEEKALQLANALNSSVIAEVKREVKEKEELIKLLKLEIQEIRQDTLRKVEEISWELEEARNVAKDARNNADIAQNEWMKAKKDLQEKLELIQMLKLECQETSERAMREVEEKELDLADALNAVTSASSSSSVAQDCVICLTNEKDMAFGCGHMTCEECGMMLSKCPICREDITNRIKLFPG